MSVSKGKLLLLKKIGLHPLSAFLAICVDIMFFGAEVSVPPSIVITSIFGFLITIPVFLLQKFASADSAKIAIAKAMIIGILTAIPSPLPSVLTGLAAILGFFGASNNEKEDEVVKTPKSEPSDNCIDINAEELKSEKK